MMYTGAVRLVWCVQMPCIACEASVQLVCLVYDVYRCREASLVCTDAVYSL